MRYVVSKARHVDLGTRRFKKPTLSFLVFPTLRNAISSPRTFCHLLATCEGVLLEVIKDFF